MELRNFLAVGHGHDSRLRAETPVFVAANLLKDLFDE